MQEASKLNDERFSAQATLARQEASKLNDERFSAQATLARPIGLQVQRTWTGSLARERWVKDLLCEPSLNLTLASRQERGSVQVDDGETVALFKQEHSDGGMKTNSVDLAERGRL